MGWKPEELAQARLEDLALAVEGYLEHSGARPARPGISRAFLDEMLKKFPD